MACRDALARRLAIVNCVSSSQGITTRGSLPKAEAGLRADSQEAPTRGRNKSKRRRRRGPRGCRGRPSRREEYVLGLVQRAEPVMDFLREGVVGNGLQFLNFAVGVCVGVPGVASARADRITCEVRLSATLGTDYIFPKCSWPPRRLVVQVDATPRAHNLPTTTAARGSAPIFKKSSRLRTALSHLFAIRASGKSSARKS